MALRPVTVTQLNEYISRILATDPLLGNISVSGEISNLKFHSSGHIYFSMVDSSSKVNCFLPASYAKNLSCPLGDGIAIVAHGYINVYKKGGTYTLFVKDVQISGEGSLTAAFERLKEKLESEGLFDKEHKKSIPVFPKKIGVVTSETGAAVRDIIKIIQSRTSLVDVIVFPVLVQGPEAPYDIARTIDMINAEFNDIDTLIVGRGGGSAEDLWAFNEEITARAVFRSKIPIISAVGHETDFSICDFVADLRAETPTAAAEKAVPDDSILVQTLENAKNAMLTQLRHKLDYADLNCLSIMQSVKSTVISRLDTYSHLIERNLITLEENDPRKILSKGYSILQNQNGDVVSSVSFLKENDRYKIFFKDGAVEFDAVNLKEGEII